VLARSGPRRLLWPDGKPVVAIGFAKDTNTFE